MKDRLDPKYFRTTPKNSWELFKWIFTEPIKLLKFSDSLSKKEAFIWFLKTYIYVGLLSFYIFIISNFTTDLNKFIFLFQILLKKHYFILIIISLIFGLTFGFIFNLASGLAFSFAFSLISAITINFTFDFPKNPTHLITDLTHSLTFVIEKRQQD